MFNNYTVVYRDGTCFDAQILRRTVVAADEQDAINRLTGHHIIHVIKHEPLDPIQPRVRFLGREFFPQLKHFRAQEGGYLITVRCTPQDNLDDVRHDLWRQVLDALSLPDTTALDPYLLDDALADADAGGDSPFDLSAWPYEKDRCQLLTVGKDRFVTIDWNDRRSEIHDELYDAVDWLTKGMPENKATLYFELWPGHWEE